MTKKTSFAKQKSAVFVASPRSSSTTQTHIMSTPLALDVAPSGDARAAALASSGGGVDALPYVDTLSDAERARAERLVAAEVSVCV